MTGPSERPGVSALPKASGAGPVSQAQVRNVTPRQSTRTQPGPRPSAPATGGEARDQKDKQPTLAGVMWQGRPSSAAGIKQTAEPASASQPTRMDLRLTKWNCQCRQPTRQTSRTRRRRLQFNNNFNSGRVLSLSQVSSTVTHEPGQ
jgi:hypothetical protein